MSSKISADVQIRPCKRISGASNFLSLWLCLLVFQAVRFACFVTFLRSDAIVPYLVYYAGGSLIFEVPIFAWIVAKHGFAPTMQETFAKVAKIPSTTSWNPLRWNMHPLLSGICYVFIGILAMFYVGFLQPGRLLRDGPCIGPIAISELHLPTEAGAIEFSDGYAHHALGGAVIEHFRSNTTETFYADPFVDEAWDPSQPIRVWVVHKKGEELTAAHRYAYICTKHNAHRMTYWIAVENSKERFQTRSAEDAILVRLDTRPPKWPNGPSYLQVLGALYLVSGLYVAAYVRGLALVEWPKVYATSATVNRSG